MNEKAAIGIAALVLAAHVVACGGAPPPPVKMSAMGSDNDIAKCPADATVVGGGYEITTEARVAGKIPHVVASRPTETGWKVECVDADGKTMAGCRAFVVCATVLH